ncbi:hypothetical protein CC2G_010163 [Coprinopsis cinerea AmutBmut pab1-1]|nr:hypothetical protein CC2G_010163 [Coprinopsis cinerea AmutBmut pab1-1]
MVETQGRVVKVNIRAYEDERNRWRKGRSMCLDHFNSGTYVERVQSEANERT